MNSTLPIQTKNKFGQNLQNIRSNVPDHVPNIPSVPNPIIKLKLNVFEPATETEIESVIMKSSGLKQYSVETDFRCHNHIYNKYFQSVNENWNLSSYF